MNCTDTKPLLQEFADNELGKENQEKVQAHLMVCQDCRQQVLEMQKLKDLFRKVNLEEDVPPHLTVSTWKAVEDCRRNFTIFDFLFTKKGFAWSLSMYALGLFVVIAGYLAVPMESTSPAAAGDTETKIVRLTQRENINFIQFGDF